MPKTIGKIRLYSLAELEKKLSVNKVTLRGYIKTGKLKGAKMGVRWMVSEDSLREYFSNGRVVKKASAKRHKISNK